jgi:hypothetical protein
MMAQHTQDHTRVEQERRRFQAALDDYLGALTDEATSVLPEKKRALLCAYAEFKYQTDGGTHCTTCRAPVRHKMMVEVLRPSGSVTQYAALCTRCLEAERAHATQVTLRVGPVEYETLRPQDKPHIVPRHGRGAVA